MYIILLRHGQAEKATEGRADADRSLTEAGIRASKANLERVLRLMPPSGSVKVITSPYLRAMQTAGIAEDAIAEIWGKERLSGSGPVTEDLLTLTDISSGPARPADQEMPQGIPHCGEAEGGLTGFLAEEIGYARGGNDAAEDAGGTDGSDAPEGASGSDASDRVIMLVGHDPQLSRLGAFLTGRDIKFSKGAAMCAELPEDRAAAAAGAPNIAAAEGALMHACGLKWFVAGPDTSRWQTLVDVEKIFPDRYGKVRKYLDRFRGGADDPDTVHDLRVAIRTLRSMLTFIEPYQKRSQNELLQRALRKIVRLFSRLREYDVLIEEAGRVDIDLTPAGGGPVPPEKLDAALSELRAAECSNARAALSKGSFEDTLDEIWRELESFEWRSRVAADGLSPDDLERRLAGMSEHFLLTYRDLDCTDADATHDIRKNAKKVRYAASVMKPLIGEHKDIVEAMKMIQDRLGRLCDVRVNAGLLSDLTGKKNRFSELALWQAQNLAALERSDEKAIVEDLAEELGSAG